MGVRSWDIGPHPIAPDSRLMGEVIHKNGTIFFTVSGPCGEGHTMSPIEARRLRDWLTANLPPDDDPNWKLTWIP